MCFSEKHSFIVIKARNMAIKLHPLLHVHCMKPRKHILSISMSWKAGETEQLDT